jgi:cytochrome b6-f complex iron-sulfur subunit
MAEDRRTLIQWLLGTGFGASVFSFVYPALRFMDPPAVPDSATNEAPAGKVSDFRLNSGKIVKFGSRPALVIRVGENEWKALSAVCTHLNCTVEYQPARHQIWCACHNGLYDMNGKVVSGPPPAPLEEYDVHLRGEDVVIAKRT